MPTSHVAFRRLRPPKKTVRSLTVATVFSFASSTEQSGGGIFALAGGTDADQLFSFVPLSVTIELPADLEISESSTLKLVVTFPLDYAGLAFTYTDTSGGAHAGTFPSADGTVNY